MLRPQEFLLRYTVIIGIIFAIVGLVVCLIAKRLTLTIRKQDVLDKSDKLYQGILYTGIALILVGMICIALPIEDTFYKG